MTIVINSVNRQKPRQKLISADIEQKAKSKIVYEYFYDFLIEQVTNVKEKLRCDQRSYEVRLNEL